MPLFAVKRNPFPPLNKYARNFKENLEHFKNFLISSSIFISINGALKVLFASLLIGVFAPNLILASFFSVYSVYSLNKLTDMKEDAINNPDRVKVIAGRERIFATSVFSSFVITFILGFMHDFCCVFILFFPLFCGIIYSVRILPSLPRLKDITGVKNLIISISWGVGSSLLPATCLQERQPLQVAFLFYFFATKSFVNSLLFDVRDIEGDRINGVRTIPVVIGREKAKKLMLSLNSTLLIWLILSFYLGFFRKYLPVLAFSIAYGYWYILHFSRKREIGKSLDLLVDGEWMPTVLLALLFACLF